MPFDLIAQYLTGAWRLMMGRNDGNALLDYSADGFWNSFFAIIVAVPPLLLSWVAFTNGYMPEDGSKMEWLFKLAVIDLTGWLAPIILVALAARPAGLADRFVPFVVATNWGGALISWLAVPGPLLRLLLPDNDDVTVSTGLIIFLISLFLVWRLINAVLQRGAGVATAVFFATTAVSIFTIVTLQDYFGLLPNPTG